MRLDPLQKKLFLVDDGQKNWYFICLPGGVYPINKTHDEVFDPDEVIWLALMVSSKARFKISSTEGPFCAKSEFFVDKLEGG